MYSVMYPEPEELFMLLRNLTMWINSWNQYLEGREVACYVASDFSAAIIAELVQLHPVMNGNKPARDLAAVVSAKLGFAWLEYDFLNRDFGRQDYQLSFTDAVWRRDHMSLKELHENYGRPSQAVKGGGSWLSIERHFRHRGRGFAGVGRLNDSDYMCCYTL